MCFSNMYFGLQTGWISMMSLQSSLLGFAIFKLFQPYLKKKFTSIENVVLQTVAVAAATMPSAAGFIGVIPALGLLDKSDHPDGPIFLSYSQLVLWSIGVAFFGVFFAVPLRKQTIIREKLRFPSGTATAQMISLLHQQPDPTLTPSSSTPSSLRQRKRIRNTDIENELSLQEDTQPLLSPLQPRSPSPSGSSLSTSSSSNNNNYSSFHQDTLNNNNNNNNVDDDEITTTIATNEDDFEDLWHLKLKALLYAFSLSSLYTISSYFFPILTNLPIFNWLCFNLIDFRAWDWYFSPSLSYVGQGIIMGLPTTLSMLLGCVIGWGILSPLAFYKGWAPGPVDDWETGSKGWLLWVALGVMISESIISLVIVSIRSITKSISHQSKKKSIHRNSNNSNNNNNNNSNPNEFNTIYHEDNDIEDEDEDEDAPKHQLVSNKVMITGLIGSTLLCILTIRIVFGDILPITMALLGVLVAMLLSVLAVRALGETDLNPVSGIGKVAQVLFATLIPGGIAANLIAGGIAEAGAQQAGDLMQDLKTGHLLHASPKAQFYGQLIGSLFSAFAASGAYVLYTKVYTIPGPEFPVPSAQIWLDMSRLVNGHPLPPHVLEYVIIFAIIFGIFVIIQETKSFEKAFWKKYIPQGIAFAIGMYNPPSFTLARVIGGLLTYYWHRYCDDELFEEREEENKSSSLLFGWLDPRYRNKVGKVLIIIIGSGFVLGEGTFALVNMMMHALHIPHF
ncbi:unnamed protein product [Cunninghamella blakesleeana]